MSRHRSITRLALAAAAFSAAASSAHAGGCSIIYASHCFDGVPCFDVQGGYVALVGLVCGQAQTRPNPMQGTIVEFIDVPGAQLSLVSPPTGWDAVLRPQSDIIGTSVPDSPSVPNIVFRYRGTSPVVAPATLGEFRFSTPTGSPPIGPQRYAIRTFTTSGSPQTESDTFSYTPIPATIDGAAYRPVGGAQLSMATFDGGPAVVVDQLRAPGTDGVQIDPCFLASPYVEFDATVLPWMLDAAPPLGAHVQLSTDVIGASGATLPDAAQLTLASFGTEHGVHFGTRLNRAQIQQARVELRLGGNVVLAYLIDPCEVFEGFINPYVCDLFITGYCYANPGDTQSCYCHQNPGECDRFGPGSGMDGNQISSRVALGRPTPVRRGSGAALSVDEIVFSMTLTPGAVQGVNSFRVSAGGGLERVALADMRVSRTDCRADYNRDNIANSQDYFDFLGDFFAGTADFNHDNVTNSQDYFDFLVAFFAGCA